MKLEMIVPSKLASIHGGQDARRGEGNVGVTIPTQAGPVQVGVQGKYSQSNYAACVDAVRSMPNVTPADIRNGCGLPPTTPASGG